jgi:hypothetical protein
VVNPEDRVKPIVFHGLEGEVQPGPVVSARIGLNVAPKDRVNDPSGPQFLSFLESIVAGIQNVDAEADFPRRRWGGQIQGYSY